MSFSIGIVGLPNVGKSTLFNAITKSEAKASNYPFCTIDPNHAVVQVDDKRLTQLAAISKSEKIIPTSIEMVDIAGLVAGASEGEGLGNKFLSHIREVKAIAHVVRLFRDPSIIRDDKLNPLKDLDIVQTELLLSDLKMIEKRIETQSKQAKRLNDKVSLSQLEILEKVKGLILEEKLLYLQEWTEEESKFLKSLNLLTFKPILLIVNIDENDLLHIGENNLYKEILRFSEEQNILVVPLCAQIECELGQFEDEKMLKEYQEILGIEGSGIQELIKQCYKTLNLITFITTGEMETRAWTVRAGDFAPQAAGVIHTDFEAGFIKAEVVAADVLIELGSIDECRKQGKYRVEGKGYQVMDGDVCHFLLNK